MPSVLNIIPEEITKEIYIEYFKLCLNQLPESSEKKYKSIYNQYKCPCGLYNYPEKYTNSCHKCKKNICPYCTWKTVRTAKRFLDNDLRDLCIICTVVKLST